MDRASQDFQSACTVWEERYGKVRRPVHGIWPCLTDLDRPNEPRGAECTSGETATSRIARQLSGMLADLVKHCVSAQGQHTVTGLIDHPVAVTHQERHWL